MARRNSNYGFFPASGTNYTVADEPELATRLANLGRALKLHLIGISGYRTPAHSVAVGGFANDPHTRGQASDTPGIEKVSETTLEKYGLTRPFPGIGELNHIQLLGGDTSKVKGRVTAARPRGGGSRNTPADWLKQAGWPSNLIPIMVAIGGAESSWNVAAESPKNTNGTIDYGWLQVNSAHGYDPARLKSDPVYTARAAYAIYKKQGLGAWSTYNNGAYKGFMGQTPDAQPGRVRPGGDASSGSGSSNGSGDTSGPDTELVAFWDHLPSIPNPLNLYKGATKAINGVGDFLKWIAWIFHPLNILRIVEFWAGFNLLIMGFIAIIMSWRGASTEDVVSLIPQARAAKLAKGAAGAAGAAKATKGASAARGGAQKARQASRSAPGPDPTKFSPKGRRQLAGLE